MLEPLLLHHKCCQILQVLLPDYRLAYYMLEEGTGGTAFDSMGNYPTGSIMGASWHDNDTPDQMGWKPRYCPMCTMAVLMDSILHWVMGNDSKQSTHLLWGSKDRRPNMEARCLCSTKSKLCSGFHQNLKCGCESGNYKRMNIYHFNDCKSTLKETCSMTFPAPIFSTRRDCDNHCIHTRSVSVCFCSSAT